MANVLVSEDFFVDTYRLVAYLDGRIDNPDMEAVRARVESEIAKKMGSQKRREMFSGYKTSAPGSSERESARQKYLDGAGIHPDWRSAEEILP